MQRGKKVLPRQQQECRIYMNGACFHSWNCATAEKQLHVSCAAAAAAAAFTAALRCCYTVAFIIVALALALYESSHKALLDSALF